MTATATQAASTSNTIYRNRWIAIARSEDVPSRHIFHGRLLGQELAVWRDDTGRINVWENRCPHRSVRLTIGSHLGDQLKCRYHGWHYATGTGRCMMVPAHPDAPPPARIGVRVFPAIERAGFIWTACGEPTGDPSAIEHIPLGAHRLRSVVMPANASVVTDALVRFDSIATGITGGVARQVDPLTVVVHGKTGDAEATLVWLVQPVDVGKAIVHGVFGSTPGTADSAGTAHATNATGLAAARRLNASLNAFHDRLELVR
ncbi:MAG: Rieske 2Fe-2S domain-containing protein [Burkholderiales bacterium]